MILIPDKNISRTSADANSYEIRVSIKYLFLHHSWLC